MTRTQPQKLCAQMPRDPDERAVVLRLCASSFRTMRRDLGRAGPSSYSTVISGGSV